MSAARDLDADRRLLQSVIAGAGEIARRHFRGERRHWHKAPGQVLTDADLEVDRYLRGRILDARPGDGWLSEETPDDGSRHRRARVWVVDPIDGTRAFADGVPEFAISVALVVEGEPVLGAVLNPATGELFEARRAGGARLNGEPLRVSAQAGIAGARLLSSRGEMKRRRWPELMPEARITTVGSLAYKLALVACGRYDGYLSLRPTHDWDIAAGDLLVREAGGRISAGDGGAVVYHRAVPSHQGLIAAPPGLHAELVGRLKVAA